MRVRVFCPRQYFEAIRSDLLSRGATILDEEITSMNGVVRATAPLAKLLGYAQHLQVLTGGAAREVMWLSHYAPRDPQPSARGAS